MSRPGFLRSGVLALLLSLSLAGAQTTYRVQPGDTFSKLARSQGVSVTTLMRLNGRQGTLLSVGELIRLPGAVRGMSAQASPPLAAVFQRGSAVYYGGRRNSRTSMTAAHLNLPFGTWVRVTHNVTGRSVVVMVNDRGPFGNASRVIDLSRTAASALGILSQGIAPVTLSIVSRP